MSTMIKPNTRYVGKAIRTFYSGLAEIRNDNPTFVRAAKLASRSYNDLVNLEILLHIHQRKLEQLEENKKQRHQKYDKHNYLACLMLERHLKNVFLYIYLAES